MKLVSKMHQALLALTTFVGVICFYYVDKPLSTYFCSHPNISHSKLMHGLTDLGLGGPYIVGLLLLCLWFWYSKHHQAFKQSLYVFISMLSAALVVDTLKIIFSRARPKLFFNGGIYGFQWFHLHAKYWSFPSGHTTVLMSVAISISLLYPRYRKFLLPMAVILSFTRVVVLAHYLSDIIAATVVSALVVTALKEKYDQGAFDKFITKSKALARP